MLYFKIPNFPPHYFTFFFTHFATPAAEESVRSAPLCTFAPFAAFLIFDAALFVVPVAEK